VDDKLIRRLHGFSVLNCFCRAAPKRDAALTMASWCLSIIRRFSSSDKGSVVGNQCTDFSMGLKKTRFYGVLFELILIQRATVWTRQRFSR
jgi:hypothetical protein